MRSARSESRRYEAHARMIRVALFLIAVALFALGFAWFADRPGEVSIVWGGWRVETSVMVGGVALLILVAALILGWSLLRGVFSGPRRVREYWQRRKGAQGYLAISRGLVAIGAGDIRAAQKYTSDAQRLAPAEPLTLLLGAQTAQLAGDRDAAEKTFRAMAGRPDTKLLGLRGLFVEAQRRADGNAAKLYAEEAAQSAPSLPWAGQAVLQLRSAAGDWAGALEMLDRNRKTAAADKADYKRKRAVLLTARALSLEHSDRDNAKTFALEAVKLAPDFVPAAALAGRFLAEAGELRKASRVVRAAWKDNPHPDLASAYIHLRFGDTARERLSRARELAAERPDHPESALTVARAALDAREFAAAREALMPLLERPTRRVALLMAEIERTEHADEGRARQWMARALNAARDPVWTADGFVSERWLPMSPVSGRLDAFEWKAPLAELGAPSAPREIAEPPAPVEPEVTAPDTPAQPAAESPGEAGPAKEASAAAPVPARRSYSDGAFAPSPPPPVRDIVVPVVPAPDDPGPEPEPDPEPQRDVPVSGWRALFSGR
jgi:HemY protein